MGAKFSKTTATPWFGSSGGTEAPWRQARTPDPFTGPVEAVPHWIPTWLVRAGCSKSVSRPYLP